MRHLLVRYLITSNTLALIKSQPCDLVTWPCCLVKNAVKILRGSHDIKQNVDTMLGKWHYFEQFLAYDYRIKHIMIQSDCAAYCCTHALNPATNPCTHQRTEGNCVACHQGELFIEGLNEFIRHLSEQILPEDNDMRNEIDTMSKVSSTICGQIIVTYMAY